MFEFFIAMVPPTITHQERKVKVVDGTPHFYEPTRLKDARRDFTECLYLRKTNVVKRHPNTLPLQGPIRLTTKWIWPGDSNHPDGAWKTTRPDTDNLIKLFKDCMTRCGFWKDDAQVCSEITEKFYGATPGIYVKVERLDE